jgi:hypothetical protein
MHKVDKEKIRKKVGAAASTTTTIIDNTLVLKKRFSKATPLESELPTYAFVDLSHKGRYPGFSP